MLGIITKSQVILKHYVFSPYFLMDVAAVIPLEMFGLAWDTEERYGYVAVLRLNRLIKTWKVYKHIMVGHTHTVTQSHSFTCSHIHSDLFTSNIHSHSSHSHR